MTPDERKQTFSEAMHAAGAHEGRMADPHAGFEHGIEGRQPLEKMPGCRSVVVLAMACLPQVNNTYVGPRVPA